MLHGKGPQASGHVAGGKDGAERTEDDSPTSLANVHPRVPRCNESATRRHFVTEFVHVRPLEFRATISVVLFHMWVFRVTGQIFGEVSVELLVDCQHFSCGGALTKIDCDQTCASIVEDIHLGEREWRGFRHDARVIIYTLSEMCEYARWPGAVAVPAEAATHTGSAGFIGSVAVADAGEGEIDHVGL